MVFWLTNLSFIWYTNVENRGNIMKESIGYTVTLNIIIVFIAIIVTFLGAALIYFKSNKASNIVTSAIEKYEGYNEYSINEINIQLSSLGYNKRKIKCATSVSDEGADDQICYLEDERKAGIDGYCVYKCNDGEYKYYKIRTNMMINTPIINNILDFPIYSNTNRLYKFKKDES